MITWVHYDTSIFKVEEVCLLFLAWGNIHVLRPTVAKVQLSVSNLVYSESLEQSASNATNHIMISLLVSAWSRFQTGCSVFRYRSVFRPPTILVPITIIFCQNKIIMIIVFLKAFQNSCPYNTV